MELDFIILLFTLLMMAVQVEEEELRLKQVNELAGKFVGCVCGECGWVWSLCL